MHHNTSNITTLKNGFKQRVFKVSESSFNALALDIFYYQAKYNPVYAKFLQLIDVRPESVLTIDQIPFLPVDFFKHQIVSCDNLDANSFYFSSSSTTGMGVSKHFLEDTSLYELAYQNSFEYAFGNPSAFTYRFLLPSYLERGGSSLVYMAEGLLKQSGKGGFYLHDYVSLAHDLEEDLAKGHKTILLGVSYALLDFAEQYPMDLSEIVVMETGGMKGKRAEMSRKALHAYLTKALNCAFIASEYGMTELMSQAYSISNGIYVNPPWMRIQIMESTDPFSPEQNGKTGQVNIMDLSAFNSCAFIATSDLGRKYDNGHFEIVGRHDYSEARGCNLMFDN